MFIGDGSIGTSGNQPVALVTTLSDEINRSWFHGIPISVLESAAEALDLPLVISHNNETNYTEKVVEALHETKNWVQKRFVLAI